MYRLKNALVFGRSTLHFKQLIHDQLFKEYLVFTDNMELPLKDVYIVNWIRPYSKLCLKYKERAVKNVNNHFFFNIEECIQYTALVSGDYSTYKEYVEITYQSDHNVESFAKLRTDWDMARFEPIVLDFYPKAGCWVIQDGVHRLCLLKFFGIIKDTLPATFFKFNLTKDKIANIGSALKATTRTVLYNGWNNKRCEFGYHSYEFGCLPFRGQRNNNMRIGDIKKHVDFANKSVIDLGCNTGGLLLHLPEIQKGRGFDYDSTCIDAANKLNSMLRLHKNLKFLQADLEKDDYDSLVSDGPFDIMFLCSLGSWIKNWNALYTWAVRTVPLIIFEENNATEGRSQIELFASLGCIVTRIIENSPDDYSGNRMRNTYLIRCPSA
jgi:hypothetical protein